MFSTAEDSVKPESSRVPTPVNRDFTYVQYAIHRGPRQVSSAHTAFAPLSIKLSSNAVLDATDNAV